eukprot:8303116-Lingulodinium_polyedra.AAC.1
MQPPVRHAPRPRAVALRGPCPHGGPGARQPPALASWWRALLRPMRGLVGGGSHGAASHAMPGTCRRWPPRPRCPGPAPPGAPPRHRRRDGRARAGRARQRPRWRPWQPGAAAPGGRLAGPCS